jgi:hypothetical protein
MAPVVRKRRKLDIRFRGHAPSTREQEGIIERLSKRNEKN